MQATAENAESQPKPELLITRLFDAPRSLVYDAWTSPEHLERWQGAPKGMTVTNHGSDVRTGGSFHITMHGEDGASHELKGKYIEVKPPERLVFTHAWVDAEGNEGPATTVTITFAERGDRTELTLHQTGFTSTGSRDGHESGWSSTFDRLGEYISTLG